MTATGWRGALVQMGKWAAGTAGRCRGGAVLGGAAGVVMCWRTRPSRPHVAATTTTTTDTVPGGGYNLSVVGGAALEMGWVYGHLPARPVSQLPAAHCPAWIQRCPVVRDGCDALPRPHSTAPCRGLAWRTAMRRGVPSCPATLLTGPSHGAPLGPQPGEGGTPRPHLPAKAESPAARATLLAHGHGGGVPQRPRSRSRVTNSNNSPPAGGGGGGSRGGAGAAVPGRRGGRPWVSRLPGPSLAPGGPGPRPNNNNNNKQSVY
ncbi:hypothetical protein E2C01_058178 [Portunus trituberculatus]|uniref:Uncharacterized protein n=1 Tax=Portunus trituberculatus TaxID=210409 RepID=A0A5B7H4L2_PORTR|nr:hypothetical protein [Portunus trituberculatus]